MRVTLSRIHLAIRAIASPRWVCSPLAAAVASTVLMTGAIVSADRTRSTDANAVTARVTTFGRLPLAFEANRGQSPAGVRFVVRGARFIGGTHKPVSVRLSTGSRHCELRRRWRPANSDAVGPRQVAGLISAPMIGRRPRRE